MTKAVSYLRTSSSVNVGEDKDSHKRQRVKIRGFAKKNAYEVSGEFYDKGISGSLDILTRPEMMKLMVHCESTGIRTIIFENEYLKILKNPDYETQNTKSGNCVKF